MTPSIVIPSLNDELSSRLFLSPHETLHLLNIGVDIGDTICSWIYPFDNNIGEWRLLRTEQALIKIKSVDDRYNYILPAPFYSEVLKLVPKTIEIANDILSLSIIKRDKKLQLFYSSFNSCTRSFMNDNVITSLYEILCWYKENHLKKITPEPVYKPMKPSLITTIKSNYNSISTWFNKLAKSYFK